MTDESRIGRYRVIRRLGQGGMGQVFLAEDPDLERQVAIKLLHQQTGHGLREEAKALAALRHPGIVTVFEVSEHDGRDFIAMEYLPGRSLRELLPEFADRRAELIDICAKVAAAVAAAHRAGILHRDIKPDNVVVTDDGQVKVVDFGIARRELDPPANATMTDLAAAYVRTLPPGQGDTLMSEPVQGLTGTPSYMAPELLYNGDASVASDVYALGVVLHECLTGKRPHVGGSLVELITNIVEKPVARLDDPLGDLVAQMLDPEPATRISLDEVVRRLAPPRPRLPRLVVGGVVAGAVLALVLVGIALFARPEPSTATVAIGIELDHEIPFGNQNPDAKRSAETLARYLASVEGTRIVAIALDGPDQKAAQQVSATHYLHGTIRYGTDGKFHARFQLADPSGRSWLVQSIAESAEVFGALIQSIARTAAGLIDPAATLDLAAERVQARLMLDQARQMVQQARFAEALPLLDTATQTDHRLEDAWYFLALTSTWLALPEARIKHAIDRAVDLAAPDTDRHAFLIGVQHYFHHRYGQARAQLRPLLQRIPRKSPEAAFTARDLNYYLGEATWHDGNKREGYELFMAALHEDPRFMVATIHAAQYCIARRDPCALYVLGLAQLRLDQYEYALGKYDKLIERGGDHARIAHITLEHPLDDRQIALELTTGYLIARAYAGGDDADANRRFAAALAAFEATQPSEATFRDAEDIGEVILTAGFTDAAARLARFLATDKTGRGRSYERFAILTAALRGDPTAIPDRLTERDTALAAAVRALIAGERVKGIELLAKVVGDPSETWDFPERALLVRELRAAGRNTDADAMCADSLRPAIFRTALLAMRRVCAKR